MYIFSDSADSIFNYQRLKKSKKLLQLYRATQRVELHMHVTRAV